MNGLALRINRGGGGKSKNSIGYSPVIIPTSFFENKDENKEVQAFISAVSTDEQLDILKKIIETNKDHLENVIVMFLVAVFFHAEAKHPIKCFISRHIIKNKHLQQSFSEALALQISAHISSRPSDYKQYVDIVTKLLTSIENFPAGAAALRIVELDLAEYLRNCLECCVMTLREQKTLSPTEKNEIFNLAHSTLRLLLHLVQKATTDNISKLILMFNAIRLMIQELMFDDDVPMDTKSLSGILYLTMHVMENGSDSWIEVLNASTDDNNALNSLLSLEAGRLSLYSAIATVVTAEQLLTQTVENGPAIVSLTNKILDIGDRSSSESAFILGVARTLLQIGKLLDKLADGAAGLVLVDSLLLFAWGHLEHYMDSVRHLTGQMLACVVKYCAKMDRCGDSAALDKLSSALQSLDRSRKSFYVTVSCLAGELSAQALLGTVVPSDVMQALRDPRLRNTASAALEAMLEKLCSSCTLESLRVQLVEPGVQCARRCGSSELHVLETLLAKACARRNDLLQTILPYIQEASEPSEHKRDLKCVLMLLRVVRRCGVSDQLCQTSQNHWRGIISYQVLQQAAVDAVDETRILSLSLIVESPKTTELFSEGDLRFVLYYLKYNINAQAPNFRQLTLSAMKKFIKRLEESYKVIRRQMQPNGTSDKVAYYLRFAEDLRRLCFDSLIPGANYSRRFVALQILAWCEQITLEGYERSWNPEYVEKLLLHLEDSYENNKAFALEVLSSCPVQLLKSKSYSISLEIEDIFRQASSLKPTECVSAAYKLDLVRTRLPEYILQDQEWPSQVVSPAQFVLCSRLVSRCQCQLSVCSASVLSAAARAPMFGVLHCLGRAVTQIDAQAISSDEHWTCLVADIIDTCMKVNAAVACVVNNSSPEGHLPMDMTVQVTDHGNSGNVTLEDGRLVTAQMVLLCAWRSVKEVSLLLGGLCSRLCVRGEEEGQSGTLHSAQLERVGEHFTSLLAETKHRGAFEQAYVGFTMLLDRLWRCRSRALHALPRQWLQQLLRDIGSDSNTLCATRRSAGLPFIIQALVTTEVQVLGNPLCFQWCMTSLLQLSGSDAAAARGHALHVLRALFRHAALAERVAPHVAAGMLAALRAFDASSWAERNSSTLLLSALVQRVFGVQRTTMTGRVFFLRYPQVYDFMLTKLQEVSSDADRVSMLRPSLYPVLLLLARLYPSSLEGTVSNLKLVAFIPHVLACANSCVLKTRQLAAKAIVPLIPPDQYISHIQSMFVLLQDPHIRRNYCHGILLQLVRLLRQRGQELQQWSWVEDLQPAMWMWRQGADTCYVITDELVKLVNLLVMRSPNVPQETITEICSYLHTLIFNTKPTAISPGRDICLANAMYLYLILATKYKLNDTSDLVYIGLQHPSYEVVLSILNYLLILHNDIEPENCNFHEHLISITDKTTLNRIKNENYIQLLCQVLKSNYLECQEKSLKILTLEGNTQRRIIETKMGVNVSDDMIIEKLFDCIQNEHEKVTHIYLQSLLDFVSDRLRDSSLCVRVLLDVIRVVLECSSSENSENTRLVVVGFIETNIRQLLEMDMSKLNEAEMFEMRATLWATIITLLEDDEDAIRQRVSDVLSPDRVTPTMSCQLVLQLMRREWGVGERGVGELGAGEVGAGDRGAALFALIALLDFQSVVVVADDVSDECRVFDQNERYNIFLEETVWTVACADIITHDYNVNATILSNIINKPAYKETFDKLCKDNIEAFRKMAAGQKLPRSDALNPKIELFVNKLL